jgi:hypothetical protein
MWHTVVFAVKTAILITLKREEHQQITLNLQQLKLRISCRLRKPKNQSRMHTVALFQLLYDPTSTAGINHLNYAPVECDTVYFIARDKHLERTWCHIHGGTTSNKPKAFVACLQVFRHLCEVTGKHEKLVRIGNLWAKNRTLHHLNIQ